MLDQLPWRVGKRYGLLYHIIAQFLNREDPVVWSVLGQRSK